MRKILYAGIVVKLSCRHGDYIVCNKYQEYGHKEIHCQI